MNRLDVMSWLFFSARFWELMHQGRKMVLSLLTLYLTTEDGL